MSSRRKSISLLSQAPPAPEGGPSDERDAIITQQMSSVFDSSGDRTGFFNTYPWHSHLLLDAAAPAEETSNTWRLKRKTNTVGVALVVCLNVGTDPPDVIKPSNCARKECWFDPVSVPKNKALETIGNALQRQYEKWQAKAKYKQCLDPTSEDLRRVCINLRKNTRSDRLLLHYNGHGVPKPTDNGELWVFGKHYSHYMPVAVSEVRSWLGDPSIYVLDCSGAASLIPYFVEDLNGSQSPQTTSPRSSSHLLGAEAGLHRMTQSTQSMQSLRSSASMASTTSLTNLEAQADGKCIVLAACKADETLPLNPAYPLDIFTSCLTTPIPTAIRWFVLQNPYSFRDISPDVFENVPGKDNDRKTPRGELHWIFTAITDTIAWDTLPSSMFKRIFRQDLLVASLFRNFLLAKRVMKSLNCTPQVLHIPCCINITT